MNAYYAHNVLGKRKYLSLCKANKQAKLDNTHITNFFSYKTLANRINNVDTGELNDIQGFQLHMRRYVILVSTVILHAMF